MTKEAWEAVSIAAVALSFAWVLVTYIKALGENYYRSSKR